MHSSIKTKLAEKIAEIEAAKALSLAKVQNESALSTAKINNDGLVAVEILKQQVIQIDKTAQDKKIEGSVLKKFCSKKLT